MNTILVTGGAGFIGGCFARQMIDQYRIVNLDKLTYAGNLDSLATIANHENHIFVKGDIANEDLVNELLTKYRPEGIVNFAAESHVDRSIDDPSEFLNTNVLGTFKLLDCALNYWRELPSESSNRFRFLHVSTDEVYGSLGAEGAFTEETPYAPNSPYSASKAASDHFVRAYHHTYGLPTLTTNCSNNYGPYQFPEKLIPLMTLNAIEGKPLPVYGDGLQVRDWLHVEDHCHAIATVLSKGKPGRVYNVGGNCEVPNLTVVNTICETVDRLAPDAKRGPCKDLVAHVNDRPGHDRRYAIDCSRLTGELGWRPRQSFASGLESTIQWYLDNREWTERITTGAYQSERLGMGE